MHARSLALMEGLLRKYLDVEQSLRILDVGSFDINGTYRPLVNSLSDKWTYVGADLNAGPNVDLVLSAPYNWDIGTASYDVVLCGQVLEHTEFPWEVFREIVRVTKFGGTILMVHPASGPEHKFPLDCWRILSDGYRALAKYTGVEVLEVSTDWGTKWCDTAGAFRKRDE